MVDKQALVSSLEETLSKPVFQAAIAKALAESLAETFYYVQQDQADLDEHLSQAKPPEAFGPGLKVMGHAVVRNTGNPQWDKKRVELLNYCKASGKYLVRTIYPQGCGANQITWIDKESLDIPQFENGKAKQVYPEQPQPPHGWRWLEVGEKFFLGDTTVNSDGTPYMKTSISKQYCESWKCQISKTFIRRNRFEVGEKVVHVPSKDILEVVEVAGDVKVADIRGSVSRYYPEVLAPYIEDNK